MKQWSIAVRARRKLMVSATAIVLSMSAPVLAQDPTEEHLREARATLNSLGATDQFDVILPNAALQLKATLIQTAPNLQDVISATVDETAIEMAGRRADLEREAALIYANNFSMEELVAIRTFYDSDAGKKLLTTGPIATRELLQAAEVWSNGVARDLAAATEQALVARLGENPSRPADGSTEESQ